MTPAPLTIALYQGSGSLGDPAANLAGLARAARTAADMGCGLIVFPEMFLSGYNLAERLPELAQPWDGPAAAVASAAARENRIAILYGYPERADGRIFNSAICFGPGGEVRARYRKTHLYGPEKDRFSPGEALVLTQVGGIRMGVLICYDVEFPGAVAALARAGADLVAVPTALMHPYCHVAERVVPTRAYENQIYIAYANRCGREGDLRYCGSSCVVGPDGLDLARADGSHPDLISAEIAPAFISRVRRRDPLAADQRPQLYHRQVIPAEARPFRHPPSGASRTTR